MNPVKLPQWMRTLHLLVLPLTFAISLPGVALAEDLLPLPWSDSDQPAALSVADTTRLEDESAASLRLLPSIDRAAERQSVRFAVSNLGQPAVDQPDQLDATSTSPFPEAIPPGATLGEGAILDECVRPIDLPTALRLAGASNLQIALARERVNQADARALAARTLWIPSLNAGVVYNSHEGRIQGTEGEVVEASRSSLFTGAAAVMSTTPATGGGGNPRMFVDLSLADAIFEPLAARQLVRASAADRTTTFNDTLLEVAAAYFSLVRAQSRVAIAEEAVRNADELAKITRDFAQSGQGLQADADRADVEAAARRRDALVAREEFAVVSANLARLLRLDPSVQLEAMEQVPAQLEFVDGSIPLCTLIAQAMSTRPELRSADAQRDAAAYWRRQEQVRPFVPHLFAGFSGGGFGGGAGSDINNFGGRSDFDVAAVWELQNLGAGNVARVRERSSVLRQASLAMQQIRELIAAEVAQSYQRVQLRGQQIDVTRPQVASASQAMRLNMEGIRGGELRPIEIQQAIGALASSRTQYLDSVVDYNVAQVQLLRAIGQPPEIIADAEAP